MSPELITLEVRLSLLLISWGSVDGKDVNIDTLEELEVRSLEYRRRGILNLCEGVGIGRVGLWV